jgi:hypothetical protein
MRTSVACLQEYPHHRSNTKDSHQGPRYQSIARHPENRDCQFVVVQA